MGISYLILIFYAKRLNLLTDDEVVVPRCDIGHCDLVTSIREVKAACERVVCDAVRSVHCAYIPYRRAASSSPPSIRCAAGSNPNRFSTWNMRARLTEVQVQAVVRLEAEDDLANDVRDLRDGREVRRVPTRCARDNQHAPRSQQQKPSRSQRHAAPMSSTRALTRSPSASSRWATPRRRSGSLSSAR